LRTTSYSPFIGTPSVARFYSRLDTLARGTGSRPAWGFVKNVIINVLAIIVTCFLVYLIILNFPYHLLPFNTPSSVDTALEKANAIHLAEIEQSKKNTEATVLTGLKVA
jgi:hypothetical protein